MSLRPPDSVRKLQNALYAKAKAEPGYRFYSLWDKVNRTDILHHAWRRCRRNGGAAGVDGETFRGIEGRGVGKWLENLQQELGEGRYRAQPLLRVWIPKRSGGQRPLGIPTIRDRVVQAAVLVVLEPIFEPDLLPEQYGFRRGSDAKRALRAVHHQLSREGRTEVVDADLADYFNTIPHGPLMRCLGRRISDGKVLAVVKSWLQAGVVEREDGRASQSNEARRQRRGTPQGGVISPFLANLYFRRFLLGWHRHPLAREGQGVVINFADDFVICCRPGHGPAAMIVTRELMERLGLTVNDQKTQLLDAGTARFDFLGYTVGRYYTKEGRPYIGTAPSCKAISRVMQRIHDETSRRWLSKTPESRVKEINLILRGWCGYFNQGPVRPAYEQLAWYTQRRLQRWMAKKHKRPGSGSRQFPHEYLYGTLGLYRPTVPRRRLPSAKA
ncbi:MAG: group II intron reverse transcriptase/maturase [Pseudomonadales bacterium]|nr:group II intron reverse transcriptase/maturase [Pseudomonadales bacterium]NIX07201.1 group II intron reverse transcriptase/maturase [Pseudomonadales bacterium]